jgi:hypothetical protein
MFDLCTFYFRQNQFDQLCNAERGWAFERVTGASLEGFDHKVGSCYIFCIFLLLLSLDQLLQQLLLPLFLLFFSFSQL